ncbi:hypothetical protein AKO1_014759 [Acrasis kona]|uniref:BRCT domain-containing protein n=1 Tax=Acrasis kona TaxID=1008807 RepID=A0AAW2Z0U3_9EUKA
MGSFLAKQEGQDELCALRKENERLIKQNLELKQNNKRRRSNESQDSPPSKVPRTEDLDNTTAYFNDNNSNEKLCICFSGFKNNTNTYNKAVKNELIDIISQIPNVSVPAETGDRDLLDDKITHVVVTPNARTMKVLQGVIKGKWIMSTKWVTHKSSNPESTDYSPFGFRRTENPLEGKKIYLSKSFLERYQRTSITLRHFELLTECAQAERTLDINEADFCLVSQSNGVYTVPFKSPSRRYSSSAVPSSSQTNNVVLTERQAVLQDHPSVFVADWTEFIDIIFPPYYETYLKRIEDK